MGDYILKTLPDNLNTNLTYKIERFIYGARVQATKLIQIKNDLSRTKLAETARQAARAEKNRQLQHGGVININDTRIKIKKKKVNEVKKAKAIVKAFEEKKKRVWKKIGREAAKAARAREKRLRNRK